jgi:hypothetical protein
MSIYYFEVWKQTWLEARLNLFVDTKWMPSFDIGAMEQDKPERQEDIAKVQGT